MTALKVLNSKFQEVEEVNTKINLSVEVINEALVHQVVKAILAGRRQGTAATKNKALVSGGGKKPFKQKGTGRARQGSSRSPLMPGGGTVFGPTPRSYEQKVNKKMALGAINAILADKYQAGKLLVVDSFPADGKTKTIAAVLQERGVHSALLVPIEAENAIVRACRNIPTVKAMPAASLSVYEAVKHEYLIVEKKALGLLEGRLE